MSKIAKNKISRTDCRIGKEIHGSAIVRPRTLALFPL